MTNYSNTRAIDGLTGDIVILGGTAYSLVEPCAQLALIVIHTKRGTCRADPSLGVDWDAVERSPTTMRASVSRAVTAAFAPFRNRITIVSVLADEGPLGRLDISIDFEDPKRPGKQPTLRTQVGAT